MVTRTDAPMTKAGFFLKNISDKAEVKMLVSTIKLM